MPFNLIKQGWTRVLPTWWAISAGPSERGRYHVRLDKDETGLVAGQAHTTGHCNKRVLKLRSLNSTASREGLSPGVCRGGWPLEYFIV